MCLCVWKLRELGQERAKFIMNVKDILERCSHLKVEKGYDISEDYAEREILVKDMEQWEKILTDILGPPVKKAGDKTTQFFFNLTVDYGGIMDDQTLFYKKFDGRSMIAMFWPWKDHNEVTLKIACFKE
jgi:hypothetical protein